MAYDSAREWLGHDAAAAYWRLTEAYVDRMRELGGDAFRRTGSLRLAGDDERDELRAEYEALREDGFAAEWRDELPEPLAGRFPGALFHPDDAVLQPARLVRRLALAAADAGVEIREHDRVEDLDALEAETVLVATDGYPSGLLGELEGLIIPTRGQMIATEPLPERLFPMPHYGRHGYDYWHQNEEGRLIVGGFRDADMDSEFTAEEATTERIQGALDGFVEALLGRMPAVTHRWSGVFGLVPDLMPVVGRHPGREGALGRRRLLRPRQRPRPDVRRPRRAGDRRRAAPAARADGSGAARRLEVDPRQVELARALVGGDRDREILDREPGRVEDRDLLVRAAALRLAGQHAPSSVTSARVIAPASTAAASSPPWLACSHSSQKTRTRAISSTAISAFPGPSAPIRLTCCPGRSEPGPSRISLPGVTVTTTSAPSASASRRGDADPELGGDGPPRSASTSQSADVAAARLQAPRRRPAVDAGADHRGEPRPAERLRRERRRSAGPQRRHGARVEHRLDEPRLGVREHDEPAHRRQPSRRVAGKRRHPLQQRVAAAERRHRAEVAGRVVRHVQLRLHRPLAARVRHERAPHGLVRALGRHRRLDVAGREERDRHGYSAFSAALTSSSAFFASAKSIEVFGS